ncbi:MAG: hypothetical protein JNL70_01035 [Saprospiraceae bacterium]|nr:hypothetical protein [Saprospiraceae bacterium]
MKKVILLLLILSGLSLRTKAQMTVGNQTLYGNEWIDYSQTYIKIPIAADGIYRLTPAALQSVGVPLSSVTANRFQLFKMGQEVPIFSTTEGNLGANDFIEFFGERNRSELDEFMYKGRKSDILNPDYSYCNDTAMYFLTWRTTPSTKRYQTFANNLTNLPAKESWFWHTDTYSATERAIWHDISGGSSVYLPEMNPGEGFGTTFSNNRTITLNPQAVVSGQNAELNIRWTGNYKSHNTVINLNGSVLGRDTFYGFNLREKKYELSSSQLTNTMSIQMQGTAENADFNAFGLVTLRYARQFNFGNERIFSFKLPQSTDVKYLEITNFDGQGSAPVLYDLTNNLRITTTLENGIVKVALPPSVKERNLVLTSVNRIFAAVGAQPVSFVDLRKDGGNYVLVSHPKFFNDGSGNNYVQEYANYRSTSEGGGMKSTVVDIFQLYDQFGYGIVRHPMSIRNFAHYIKKNWANPQYLLLVGKGRETESSRSDIVGVISKIDMPTWGYPGGDNMLVVGDSTVVPIIPIGRIPCTTAGDIKTYLEKVKTWERNLVSLPQTLGDRDWQKNVMHLSGGGDVGNIIKEYMKLFADSLIASKAGVNVTTFYKTSLDPVQTAVNDQIFNLINKGTSLITFYGHSASAVLDFDINNPDAMNNVGKYPLFIALGCSAGNCHQNAIGIAENFIFYKDKGMSAFAGTTGTSFLNSLNRWASAFYTALGNTHYGQRIGDVTKGALATFSPNSIQYDLGLKSVLQEFQLTGDPALRYFAAPGPDFVTDAAAVKFTPSVLTAQLDSFDVTFSVNNIGYNIQDSISILLRQELPNKTFVELAKKKIAAPAYKSLLTWRVPMPRIGVIGQNRLHITVDADNTISELPAAVAESNNELVASTGDKGVPFFILDNNAKPVYPAEFAIVNKTPIVLKASTSNALAKPQNYIIEVDTTTAFNSPLKKRTVINQIGGILKWQPDMSWTDNTVYYWRIAADSTAGVGYAWQNSSFIYLKDGTEGWNQSHYYQWLGNEFTTMKVSPFDRKFEFSENLNSVDLRYNPADGIQVTPKYYLNNNERGRNKGFLDAGIYVVVFDGPTGNEWWKPWVQPKYGIKFPSGDNTMNSYIFKTDDASPNTGRAGLIEFIDKIVNDGDYVIVFTVQQSQTANYRPDLWGNDSINLGTNIFRLLESQGAKRVRELLNGNGNKPYSFAFQKNRRPLAENIGQIYTDGAPISFSMLNNWYEGKMQSKPIGPAKEWQALDIKYTAEQSSPTIDSLYFDLIGISNAGKDSLLIANTTNAKTLLNTIDAKQFPYLKLRFYGYDKTLRTAPQVNYWRIFYKGFTELAVNPNSKYSIYSDTLQQGDNFKIDLNVENISDVDADSVLVKWTIRDAANVETSVFNKYAPLSRGGSFVSNLTRSTKDMSGKQQISFEVNPNLTQPEQYTFNNYLQTNFFVEKDKKNPLLDVMFDGVRIMNNDIVSSKPLIMIELRDENKYLALNDTSLFKLYVQTPSGSKQQIFFNTPSVKFNPATITATGVNKATIEYRPTFTVDGTYQLIVKAKDATGNVSGDMDYSIAFQIITKSSISNVLNYPNPFSTRTQFVYTLTGETPPQYFKIQIMSVSGKVVREITQDEIGVMKIGTHRTEYSWDGTDEYGNKLANGVYLYRVIAKGVDGKAFESYDTGTSDYFKKGIGKLVIMR